jgi:Tfp pilus assembly protein PilX
VIASRQLLRRWCDDDRGSGFIGAFIVLFAILTLGGVGVLVDSARIVSAERHASSAAFEAARAGAQAVHVVGARDGVATIDASGARAAALDAASGLLSGSGATVTSVTVTADEVVVTVSRRVDPWFPVLSGSTVFETGRARIIAGITQEGQ